MGEPKNISESANPYLEQHKDNPVAWLDWSEDAFVRAEKENKPVFLSIGYSTCHWCHRMAHESFEDRRIAEYLNENFICIKLDREERPDIDQIYQLSHQLITKKSGGWPLSVWLLPDKTPFFAGTYFPKEDNYDRPGFLRVLETLKNYFDENASDIAISAAEVHLGIKQLTSTVKGEHKSAWKLIKTTMMEAQQDFDQANGGFGNEPKFPPSTELDILMFINSFFQTEFLDEIIFPTLRNMARGGIYDQIDGGFHRYSVTADWRVPHFEKMLYDQAMLVPLYVRAFEQTNDVYYWDIAEQTCDFVLSDFAKLDGFASALDADFEGGEGLYYVWTYDEVTALLGSAAAGFIALYGVSESGNFDNANILAISPGADSKIMRKSMPDARRILSESRKNRGKLFRDAKVITSWNALFSIALLSAGRHQSRFIDAAHRCLCFLWDHMVDKSEQRVYRAFYNDERRQAGQLEDYAFLAEAFIHHYMMTFDGSSIERAATIARWATAYFYDTENSGFFDTDLRDPEIISRNKSVFDTPLPSAFAKIIEVLLIIDLIKGSDDSGGLCGQALSSTAGILQKSSRGLSTLAKAFILAEMGNPVIEIDEHHTDCVSDILSALPETVVKPGNRLTACHRQKCSPLTDETMLAFPVKSLREAMNQ